MRPSIEHLTTAYESFRQARKVPSWYSEAQDKSWQRFAEHGLPWRKDEHWKYTSLYHLAKIPVVPAPDGHAETGANPVIYTGDQATVIALANGRYTPSSSSPTLPDGVTVTAGVPRDEKRSALSRQVVRPSVLQDLNAAFAEQWIEITIADNTTLSQPLYLWHHTSGEQLLCSPRLVINVGRNCDVTVVEHYGGAGDQCVINGSVSVAVAENSQVHHTKLQTDHDSTSHLINTNVDVSADSRYTSLVIDMGARLARSDLGINLNGQGAAARLYGVFLPAGGQHFDHHSFVKHNLPHTASEQDYHGVVGHGGHGVFNGKVLVQPDAQKIEAVQSNDNILLSTSAEIDTKPELEIYADDVKCAHGATVGQLDETSLFYLQSRGLSRRDARHLLVEGFIRETFATVKCDHFRAFLDQLIETKLNVLVDQLPLDATEMSSSKPASGTGPANV
ncbi:MAG: Fe-S cluster assembly protein SufD [Gammaproteobacteria bacterium]|nr:Fe-S cluster assembly protein SufD [Gammaproteobacteria bacterium]